MSGVGTGGQMVQRGMLTGLTGLRGVGAVWVVVFHAQYGFDIPLANAGYLGVDLFFILSGFVLSHARFGIQWSWRSYFTFVRDRFARIFPMNWAALVVVGLVLWWFPAIIGAMPARFEWRNLPASLLLVQNWGVGGLKSWNSPAWSLSTEWFVSLAFPVFLGIARRVDRTWIAVALGMGCIAALAVFLQMTDNTTLDVIDRAGLVRTLCEFMVGCLLHRIYLRGTTIPGWCLGLAIVCIMVGMLVPALALVAVGGFPVLILHATRGSTRLARWLSTPMMGFLGDISYSVYLLHWPLLLAAQRLEGPPTGVFISVLWFCGYLVVTLALSAVTYRVLEMPARRWLRGPR